METKNITPLTGPAISKQIQNSDFVKGISEKYVLLLPNGDMKAFDSPREALVEGYSIYGTAKKFHVEYIS